LRRRLGMNRRSLAKLNSYNLPLQNCGDGLNIKTGIGCRQEKLPGPIHAGLLEDEVNLLIWEGYVEFSVS